MNICTKCGKACDVVTSHWKEKEEFWGAPCWRDCYEDVSECCEAEMEEVDAVEAKS